MSIEEVTDDIKQIVGGKGLWIVGGVFALLFIVSLTVQNKGSNEDTESNVSLQGAYSSYPDMVTNADVVISTLQDSIDFQTEHFDKAIEKSYEEMDNRILQQSNFLTDSFNAQNKLMEESYANQQQLLNNMSDTLMNDMDNLFNNTNESLDRIVQSNQEVLAGMDSHYNSLNESIYKVKQEVWGLQGDIWFYGKKMDQHTDKVESSMDKLADSQKSTNDLILGSLDQHQNTQEMLNTTIGEIYTLQGNVDEVVKTNESIIENKNMIEQTEEKKSNIEVSKVQQAMEKINAGRFSKNPSSTLSNVTETVETNTFILDSLGGV